MARLLLIDDDPDLIREQIDHVFGASGHEIEVARTGEQGSRDEGIRRSAHLKTTPPSRMPAPKA